MKTRAALALSVAGILVTGSAALAVNTQVLNSTPAGTGNANSVLLPNSTGRTPAPAAVVSAKATPDVTSAPKGSTTTAPPDAAGKGGRRTAPLPGPGDDRDAKAGTLAGRDDAGPARSQPAGTAGSPSNAGPAVSQPAGTAGSGPAAGNPAVVVPPSDDKGGVRPVPEPGDDKGGQRKASEPGDDGGGHSPGD